MAVFKYVVITESGQEQKGFLEGDSENQIRDKLRERGLIPLEVSKSRHKKNQSSWTDIFSFKRNINQTDLTMLTYQFSTLLKAGLPVEECLHSMAEQSEKSHLKSILLGVHGHVTEGESLSDSMGHYPGSFPEMFRSSIAAGEKSGQLSKVLQRLADYLERQQAIQSKVQQALIYPSLLTLISIGIVIFLLTYAVPKIVTIFSSTGQDLPWLTVLLLDISFFAKTYGYYVLALLVVLGIAIYQLLKKPQFKFKYQQLILKIPLIGNTIKEINTARFSRTFGILFASSVPVLEAMKAAQSIVKILPMRKSLDLAIDKVREGTSIHKALQETNFFSALSIRLIAAGEMSGSIEMTLEKTADYQERMVTKKIDISLSLFEPLMIIVMGGVVLFIVLAILLPIFEINQLIG